MIPVSNVTHRSKVNNAASNTMHMILLALVCEISKLFQETVNDCLAELSLSKRENASMGWVALEVDEAASSQSRKLEMTHEYCWSHDAICDASKYVCNILLRCYFVYINVLDV